MLDMFSLEEIINQNTDSLNIKNESITAQIQPWTQQNLYFVLDSSPSGVVKPLLSSVPDVHDMLGFFC